MAHQVATVSGTVLYRLALTTAWVYGDSDSKGPALPLPRVVRGRNEGEGAMSWTKPAFDEIKMDAEAKSYRGEDL
ncbi:MAG: hypothetical protein AUG04_08040 [Deltaproteobacteria bacterium 13_1_20CM_2_69_21]|nr:MAG: hypothetical protein AUH41_07285 [Gemmatimonadetes bacterium 13_1_40CM_66_11]OLC75872.1 MAG: hypothetical protein AUH83_07205 [Deltaproteobacteria bacterium 13_1_40CM_4_68_19]OLD68456.1 MAG: hypothetical protein AUI45_10590 [Acidobacteria bacterium 13_1_40CM_2_56_11]OLE62852.1 MAG: hypothetical protein AUG04_08040 [Deltaproteobacteria bacterium 13_1_20CM_2_69_21]